MKGSVVVVGLGLIGGSLAKALKSDGWHVLGSDTVAGRAEEAVALEVIDGLDDGRPVHIAFIATPVSAISAAARAALARSRAVSDVGSVKAPVVREVDDPRFVGGHPMAGSEKSGLAAVQPNLFHGATWVLTPTAHTEADAYLAVRSAVASLGAEVVTLEPVVHDEMVATVSHVPHLTASALMKVAVDHADNHEAVLRLAAGGFRDMTRIAAGHPGLWTDISLSNSRAIADGLDRVIATLGRLRDAIRGHDAEALEAVLTEAASARAGLPAKQGRPTALVTLAIEIPDQPASLARIFGLLGDLNVNVEDLEINHAIEGTKGTLLVDIAAARSSVAVDGLRQAGVKVVERES